MTKRYDSTRTIEAKMQAIQRRESRRGTIAIGFRI
jgi:hypothetical protein